MICAQFIRMFTPRNVVVLLFLQVSFSFVIANNPNQGKNGKKNNPKQSKCAVISIADGTASLFNPANGRSQPIKIVKGRPQPIGNGRSIRYTCVEEYQIYGNDTLTCRKNGNWSSPAPVCVAPECPEISDMDDGPLKRESINPYEGAVLRFSCASGFELHGLSTIIYCSEKRWSDDPPECIPIPGSATVAPEDTKPSVRFSVTYLQPTEKSTTHVKSVKTTTSGHPAVDESPTTAQDEIPLSATVEKATTEATPRMMIVTVATKTPSLPRSTRIASSIAELDLPITTMTTAELLQSVDSGDITSHPTLKAAPSSVQPFISFPGDAIDSDSVSSDTFARITHSVSGKLTEAQSTQMFHQDEETSQKPFTTADSVVSTAETHSFSSAAEMVSEREEHDDTTPETLALSSATAFRLEEKSEDGEAEIQSPTSESVSTHTTSPELLTEESLIFSFSSSFTEESDDVIVPFEHDSTVTELNEDHKQDPQTITPPSSVLTNNLGYAEAQTESSSDDSAEKMPTHGDKTGESRVRSQSVPSTHAPPSNLSGYKSLPASASSVDSSAMTTEDRVSVGLIIIIVAAIIVLVVLLSILGKALLPKCTLFPKPCPELGAVPYTEQTDQSNEVVLKGMTSIENNSCTQV